MRFTIAAWFLLIFATGIYAHRTPEALTAIEYNPNTESTEIAHRLHVHDVEPNMDRILEESGQSLEAIEGRARVSLYVHERFSIISNGENEPIALSLVGAEVEGDYLYVYQEYGEKLTGSLKIRNGILRDVFPMQINTVNIKVGSRVRSLVFAKRDEWKLFNP